MIWGKTKTHHILGKPPKMVRLTLWSFPLQNLTSHLQELLLWHRKGLEKLMAQSQGGRRARGRRWRCGSPSVLPRFCFRVNFVPKNPKGMAFLGREMGPLISGKLWHVGWWNIIIWPDLCIENISKFQLPWHSCPRFNKSEKWAQRKVTSIHTIHTGLGVRALVFSKVGFCS